MLPSCYVVHAFAIWSLFLQDLAPGDSYFCSCPFGLGGDNCTTDTVDSCLSNPCSIDELCEVSMY